MGDRMARKMVSLGGRGRMALGAQRLASVDSEEVTDNEEQLATAIGFLSGAEMHGCIQHLRGLKAGAVVLTPTGVKWQMDGAGASDDVFSVGDAVEHTFTVTTGLGGYLDSFTLAVDNGTQADIAFLAKVEGYDPNGEIEAIACNGETEFEVGALLTTAFKVRVRIPVGAAAPADIKVILSAIVLPVNAESVKQSIRRAAFGANPHGAASLGRKLGARAARKHGAVGSLGTGPTAGALARRRKA